MAPHALKEEDVLDLTPHLNDPCEQLLKVFKGFCGGLEFDLGERRPPLVSLDAIAHNKPIESRVICGDGCLQQVNPCISDDEVAANSRTVFLASAARVSTPDGENSALFPTPRQLVVVKKPLPDCMDQPKVEMPCEKRARRRTFDVVCVTAFALVVTSYLLQHCGCSFHEAFLERKSISPSTSFSNSRLDQPRLLQEIPRAINTVAADEHAVKTQTLRTGSHK